MTNRSLLFLVLAISLAVPTAAQEAPSFHPEVLTILQKHCQDCHRSGGVSNMGMVAPMALLTYEDVRPWAKSIARQVEAREMPPWHASEEFHGVFSNQRTLTKAEVEAVVEWARAGAPKGDPALGPQARAFPANEGWSIGEPDLVVRFEEPVLVDDDVKDVYKTVTVAIPEEDLPEDRYIQAMEFRPGSDVVHHIVIFTSDQRESIGFGAGMLGGMGPGTDATVLPPGYGRKLSAGSRIMFNMHYHKEPGPGTATWDQSEIAFKFHDRPVETEVHWGAVGTMAFEIPPHAEDHLIVAEESFERDVLLFALFPHTHLRGKASKFVAHYPDGSNEVLLDVPRYDFDWQTNYIYAEPKRLPAGTRLEIRMHYTNTAERAALTGIDPSRTVRWGQPTTDEMMYGFFDYAWADERGAASSGAGGGR